MELRLGRHVIRLETNGDPFGEWSHIQETRVTTWEKGQYAGGQESSLQGLEDSLVVRT